MIVKTLQRAYMDAVSNSGYVYAILGREFEIPSNAPWWEMVHVPNDPSDQYYGDEDIKRGIMRIMLHWPFKNTGEYEPIRQLEPVTDAFKKGTKLFDDDGNSVDIYRIPRFTGKFEDDRGPVFPVTVWYRSFRP